MSQPQHLALPPSNTQTFSSLIALAAGGVLLQALLLVVDSISWVLTKPRLARPTRPGLSIQGLLVFSAAGLIASHFWIQPGARCTVLLPFIYTSHLLTWVLYCVSFTFATEPRWRRRSQEGFGLRSIAVILCLATLAIWMTIMVMDFNLKPSTPNGVCEMKDPVKFHFAPWILQLFSSMIFAYLFQASPHHPTFINVTTSKARGSLLLCISFGLNLCFFLVVYFHPQDSLVTVQAISLSTASNFTIANEMVKEGPFVAAASEESQELYEPGESRNSESHSIEKHGADGIQFEPVYLGQQEELPSQDASLKSQKSAPFLRRVFTKGRSESTKAFTISGPLIAKARSASISTFPGLWAQRSPSILPSNERDDYFAPSPSTLRNGWTAEEEHHVGHNISSPPLENQDRVGLKSRAVKNSAYPPTSSTSQLQKAMKRASSSLWSFTARTSLTGPRTEIPVEVSSATSNSDGSSTRFYPRPVKGKVPGLHYASSSLDAQSTLNTHSGFLHPEIQSLQERQRDETASTHSAFEGEVITFPYSLSTDEDFRTTDATSRTSEAHSDLTITPSTRDLDKLIQSIKKHQDLERRERGDRSQRYF